MSDNGETPKKTPMDQKIDQASPAQMPPFEKYDPVGLEGRPIAQSRQSTSSADDTKLSSWAMAEVERSLAGGVLKTPRDKLDAFAKAINQKQDLRLRSLSRLIHTKLVNDHAKEISSGPTSNRVREFDLQSQTMRMVTANATLGSYQFQQTQSLPYMRKSLALGYQKVSLLKTIARGIGSLEKALVSKLEAIKINTAAAAPRKMSFFKKLWIDVANANRSRIANNISDFTMDGWSSRYKKYVVPGARKVSSILADTSLSGGINGLRSRTTGAVNSSRRTLREVAQNADTSTRSGRIKRVSATAASGVLGGIAGIAQKLRLGKAANANTAKVIKPLVDLPGRFNPFSKLGYTDTGIHGFGKSDEPPTLLGQFEDWRKEYSSKTDTIIEHLSAIRGTKKVPGGKRGGGGAGGSKPSASELPECKDPADTPPSRSLGSSLRDRLVPKGSSLKSPLSRSDGEDSPTLSDVLHGVRERRSKRKAKVTSMVNKIRHEIHEAYYPTKHEPSNIQRTSRWSGKLMDRVRAGGSEHPVVNAGYTRKQKVVVVPPRDATPDRAFFASIFDRLGKRMDHVSSVVDDGNRKRTLFERLQERWKQIGDRSAQQKTRKNSYEDLEAHRPKNKKPLESRVKSAAKGATRGVGANLAQGNILGAGGSILSNLFGMGSDKVGSLLGRGGKKAGRGLLKAGKGLFSRGAVSVEKDLAKKAVAGVSGKTAKVTQKVLAKGGKLLVRGAAGTARLGARATVAGLKATPAIARGGWSAAKVIVPGAARLGWGATKLAAGVGGGLIRGVAGAGLGLGKTLLSSAAKGIGPSLVVGLGAHLAGNWLDKNTTGLTHRLGKTATRAAEWGAAGAVFGPWGAGIGAAMGAIYENSDLLATGLKAAGSFTMRAFHATGSAVANVGSVVWHGVVGKAAVVDASGKVKYREQQSVLGGIKSALFGSKTTYSKSGDVVKMGQSGLFPTIGQGLKTTMFGEKASYDKNGKIINKGSPPLLESLKGTFFGPDARYDSKGNLISAGKKSFIQRTLTSVSKNLFGIDPDNKKSVFGQLKDKFTSVGQDLTKGVGSVINGIKNGMSAAGGALSSAGGAVADAAKGAYDAAASGANYVVQSITGNKGEMFQKIMGMARGAGDPHPEVTAAQWALESGWGKSMSGKNNPFGQKARKGEPATTRKTWEIVGGSKQVIMAPFKDYPSLDAAIQEHVEKWTKRKTNPGSTPIQAAAAIKAAGYATDPAYVMKLGKMMAMAGVDPTKPLNSQAAGQNTGGKSSSKSSGASGASPTAGTWNISGALSKTGYNSNQPQLSPKPPAFAPTAAVKLAQAAPVSVKANTAGTTRTPVRSAMVKEDHTPAPIKTARPAKTQDASAHDSMSASTQHIANLIESISHQTKAISDNTAALSQHGTSLAAHQKAATAAAEATTKTAATIIPVMAQHRAAPAQSQHNNTSPLMGVVMSMAKTVVRTGNHT